MKDERPSSNLSKFLFGLLQRSLSVVFIGVLCLTILAISEWSIDPRLRKKNAELQTQLSRIELRVQQLKDDSRRLRDEIIRLKGNPNETLYHARNSLGMVRPGEVIYQFDDRHSQTRDASQ